VSQEFGYSYNKMSLSTRIETGEASELLAAAGVTHRQFTYNLLLHALQTVDASVPTRPSARWCNFDQARRCDRQGAQASQAHLQGGQRVRVNLGIRPQTTPEGGGVFQLGVQYGAGVKFNLIPSYPSLRSVGFTPTDYDSTGPLRLRQLSLGLGLGFWDDKPSG
jgi:hypothetical protein